MSETLSEDVNIPLTLAEHMARKHYEAEMRRASDYGLATSSIPWEELPPPVKGHRIAVEGMMLEHLGLLGANIVFDAEKNEIVVSTAVTRPSERGNVFVKNRTDRVPVTLDLAPDPQPQAPKSPIDRSLVETIEPVENKPRSREHAREMGYTGEFCGKCGSSRMKRAGACMVCEDCGDNSGCG